MFQIFYGAALLTLLLNLSKPLSSKLISYGKTLHTPASSAIKDKRADALASILQTPFLVPKSWFVHFYALGCAWSTLLLLDAMCFSGIFLIKRIIALFAHYHSSLPTDPMQKSTSELVLVGLALVVLQTGRRLHECLYIHRTSSSTDTVVAAQMHAIHYLIGLAFYTLVPLTIIYDHIVSFSSKSSTTAPSNSSSSSLLQQSALTGSSIVLFIYSSIQQHESHRILAASRDKSLRKKDDRYLAAPRKTNNSYFLPLSGWFKYILFPHYTFETCIYISIWLATTPWQHLINGNMIGSARFSVIVWTATSLAISGLSQREWYDATFGVEQTCKLRNFI